MTDKIILKSINELLGEHFYIPHYQRGYRWTEQQVSDLLNDIWSFANKPKDKAAEFYCLQPVVVKKKQWNDGNGIIDGYEVVDGQQRLTTIYIVLNYLAKEFLKVETLKEEYGKEIYSLRYETRPKSEEFLKNILPDRSNIDFYHISSAYENVKDWFTNSTNVKDRTDKNRFLDTLLGKKDDERSVQIIWYEADQEVKSVELFTRLNMGKIPLTNAELIKALFLSSSSFEKELPDEAIRRKMEISQLWDDMEQKLCELDFWSFVTTENAEKYATKIELLFDFIAMKNETQKDPHFTFLFFLKESKENTKSLWDLWMKIERYYFTLVEWKKNKNLYHKIGYLVQVGENIRDLIELSISKEKSGFEDILDERIRAFVNYDIEALDYENKSDYVKISNVLLLFNVESIRSSDNINDFYPFKFHKDIEWSLEHIHAQNSMGFDRTKSEPWLNWLKHHKKLIEELFQSEENTEIKTHLKELLGQINELNAGKITWEIFEALSGKIIKTFSDNDGESTELHSISNLALLSQPDNSALSNAVFEVKRREIIEMDKRGKYIPICTRRVFLKYYNDKPSSQQYYFWSKEDRENYMQEMKTILINYLPEEIKIFN